MKRKLAFLLVLVMLFGALAGCQNQEDTQDTTQEAVATQSAEEQAVLKILTIGNSHSLDATNLLYEVFKAEAPDQQVVLGTMYYSGCNMQQHADYVANNKAEYDYYKNDSGMWNIQEGATVEYALKDEQWDIVVMQQMNHRAGMEDNYVASQFQTVIDCILENQEVAPKLAFHMTWTNPDDYALYLDDDAPLNNPSPEGWRNAHETNFGGADGKYDQSILYEKIVANVQKYLVDTTGFLGKDYYELIIPSATAVEYAQDVLGMTQEEVYRDYTHMNDYGRLMVSYLWYAEIMELESISAVNVNAIPKNLHHSGSQYPSIVDLAITDDMKADLIAAVNYALANPFELPAE